MSAAQGIGAPLADCVVEPLLTQLLRLFPSRGNSHIRRIGSTNWRQMSQFHYLTDEEISAAIDANPVYVRAATLDDTTNFLVITVPSDSRYIESHQFARLIKTLRALSVNPKIYKAADSDDIQIYLPFAEKTNTTAIQRVLTRELINQSFEIAAHSLIIHSTDVPFALPLQAGFAWLNDDQSVKVRRDDISLDSAIALFVSDIKRVAVHPAVLLDRPASPTVVVAAISSTEEILIAGAEPEHALGLETNLEEVTELSERAAEEYIEPVFEPVAQTQLSLFSLPTPQKSAEETVPPRRRRRRPRSDPQAPRAEPGQQIDKLLFDTPTETFSSSNHNKEATEKD